MIGASACGDAPLGDRWSVATTDQAGRTLVARVRVVPPRFDRAQLPHLLGVQWRYAPNEGGMPDRAALARMDELERLLDARLPPGRAALTAVVTGDGVRAWQWYVRDPAEARAAVAAAGAFPVTVDVQADPGWQAYAQLAPP